MSKMVYDDFLLKVIGTRLKQLREEYGLSRKEMSKVACIDLDSYTRVENGKRNASVGLFCNIARGLKITPTEIFNDQYKELLNRFENDRIVVEFFYEKKSFMINKDKVISMIKNYRRKKSISQQEMSVMLGVSRNKLNNLEYGRGKVDSGLLIAFMNLIGIDAEKLFEKIILMQ